MKAPVDPSRDGDQLRLRLFEGEPWDGLSPRVLTRGNKLLYLRPEPSLHEVMPGRRSHQLELWPDDTQREKAPLDVVVSRGAPLLVDLDRWPGR